MSEDITFCGNRNCKELRCYRNPKHIRLLKPHSFSLFEGTQYCYKVDERNKVDNRTYEETCRKEGINVQNRRTRKSQS